MAIPIRVISGDRTVIPLVAESMDISVQRQLSAFPVPGPGDRVAIDMNLPQIEIEINGVLVDDDLPITSESTLSISDISDAEVFNFAGIHPRGNYASNKEAPKHRVNAVTVGDTIINVYNFETDSVSHFIGGKIHTLNSEFVGIIIGYSVSSSGGVNTITNFEIIAGSPVDIAQGERVYITAYNYSWSPINPDSFVIHEKQLSFYPNYWRDTNNTPTGLVGTVVLEFDEEHDSNRTTLTTATYGPSLVSPYDSADVNSAIKVNVPIGGIWLFSTNGDPAKTLALVVKDALTLATNVITNGKIHPNGGRTLADAFDVTVVDSILIVKQKYQPPTPLSGVTTSSESQLRQRLDYQSNQGPPANSNTSKSAGDKVQDLIGIFANADEFEDQIRGIQIPYDSLITSDNVTPVARNFFLTAGNVTPASKTSEGNLLPASDKMVSLGKGYGGVGNESDPDEDIEDLLGATEEFVRDFYDFLRSATDTLMATLDRTPVSNPGGMRILPVTFHARYDAGNKHYNFDMKLIASDFVIGV